MMRIGCFNVLRVENKHFIRDQICNIHGQVYTKGEEHMDEYDRVMTSIVVVPHILVPSDLDRMLSVGEICFKDGVVLLERCL